MRIRDWLSNLIFNLIFWVCAGTARRTLWSTLGSSERWRSPDSDFYLLRIDDTKALHSNTHTRSLQEIGTLHSLRKTGNIQQNFDAVGFFSHFKKTKNFLYLFQVSLVNIFFSFLSTNLPLLSRRESRLQLTPTDCWTRSRTPDFELQGPKILHQPLSHTRRGSVCCHAVRTEPAARL